MTKKVWYSDLIEKVREIEKYRNSKKVLTEQDKKDNAVALAMLIRGLKINYKKITNNEILKVKAKNHIDKIYKKMQDDKVKNVMNDNGL